jgi:exodeoxyribonuclease V alpha subunit
LLVLLGDADQLPSVEAGAVFRDLAPLGVRLIQSHRMDPRRPEGRRILALATAVKAGARDVGAQVTRRASAALLQFDGVELCPTAALPDFLGRWFEEKLRASPALLALGTRNFVLGDDFAQRFDAEATALLDQVFDHHQRFRLLAVTRARPTGTLAINAWMHARSGGRGPGYVAGEPVMVLRNDYERGLWNGDQGLIVNLRESDLGRAARPARLGAVFKIDGHWTAFPLDGLGDSLTLAFALTVHKAQGSEYDEVALVLPEAAHPLLTRDLLYTALTRCRNALVLCGDEAVLQAGIGNAIQRTSSLASGLSATLPR